MSRPAWRALPFTRFVAEVLRVQLTPAQQALCLVAFDGIEPRDLDPASRELARQIFGDVDVIPAEARHVIAALCGARAGKSYIFGALLLLYLALTVPLDTLAPGEVAAGIIVAPDLRLARQAMRYAIGAARGTPSIARLITAESADSLTLRRPDGRSVELACLPATRGGSAVRGRSLVGAVLDEAAFFRDVDFVVNDSEIFKAAAPRVVHGGFTVIESTPWAKSGLLNELYERNHGHPVDAIAAHAPTLLLRDDAHTRALVARERDRDPDNALREFDAVPMAFGTTQYMDPLALKFSEDDSMPLILEPAGGVCSLDTAFRKDASAATIVRPSPRLRGIIECAECVEIRPAQGQRLVPTETLKQLLARAREHKCRTLAFDQHYADLVHEVAGNEFQCIEAPGGLTGKIDVYQAARTLIHEGKVRIPAGNRRLLNQLREVVSKPTSGGGITITSPRRPGSHGDLASAFVLALWAHRSELQFDYEAAVAGMREMGV